jgi:SagB-type dehydrogenase family enzyme
MSVEEALAKRRSVREFALSTLNWQQIGQLLWAAQGITHPEGLRTAPSAGALYPLQLYVATPSGFYHYNPQIHRLERRSEQDLRPGLYRAAWEQESVLKASAVFLIAAIYQRTARKYGKTRSVRYVHLEAGHAAQSLMLQAVALGLGSVPIGAFDDGEVQKVLSLVRGEEPIYLIPVGVPIQS